MSPSCPWICLRSSGFLRFLSLRLVTPSQYDVDTLTVYKNGRRLWDQKVKPMWKFLKPVLSRLTSRGQLQWFNKVPALSQAPPPAIGRTSPRWRRTKCQTHGFKPEAHKPKGDVGLSLIFTSMESMEFLLWYLRNEFLKLN